MSTVYTINGKVLKNAANDKWLTKKETPAPSFDEITIGTQTWIANNLSIDDGGTGIYHEDNVTANGVNMGTQYYYTADAAIRIANSIPGWHLPTIEELQTLVNYATAIKLKSTTGWPRGKNGTDNFNWGGYPVGGYTGSQLHYLGETVSYLSSSYNSGNSSYYYYFLYSDTQWSGESSGSSDLMSVRLIKDT